MPAIKDTKDLMKQIRLDGSELAVAEVLKSYKTEVHFINQCMICGESMEPDDSYGELGYILGNAYKFLKLCPPCFKSAYRFLSNRRLKASERSKFIKRVSELVDQGGKK